MQAARTGRTISPPNLRLFPDLAMRTHYCGQVDESLIGGLVIQVGDTVYDSSLRTRIKTLAGRLTERTLNEIQSGRDRFSHPEGD